MNKFRAINTRRKDAQENDYYATDPRAIDLLLEHETFTRTVWEPACGGLHLSKRLESYGYNVINTDLIKRAPGVKQIDFLEYQPEEKNRLDIITNPPYKYARDFIEHALEISGGRKNSDVFKTYLFRRKK